MLAQFQQGQSYKLKITIFLMTQIKPSWNLEKLFYKVRVISNQRRNMSKQNRPQLKQNLETTPVLIPLKKAKNKRFRPNFTHSKFFVA